MINHSVNPEEIGRRITELRKKQKKSQKFFADLVYISPSYLALIEKGKRTATVDVLAQIAAACDVSIDYLLFGDPTTQEEENQLHFQRLCKNNTPEKLSKALRIAEYYLSIEEHSTGNLP